jgi:hypothetical protein
MYPRCHMSDLEVDNYGLLRVLHFVAFLSHIIKLALQVDKNIRRDIIYFDFDPSYGVCFDA